MTRLTPAQHALLTAILATDDGALDAPDDRRTIGQLIKRSLIISLPQQDGPSRLILTEAGRQAVKVDEPQPGPGLAVASPPEPTDAPEHARAPGGKLGQLIALLQRPEGATIEAMSAATGWQAHSVRGAISGALKKKHGLTVSSQKEAGGRVYRIDTPAEA